MRILSAVRQAERLSAILERLSGNGSVGVADIAGELGVSSATIRRDLQLLESQRLLARTHGGAVAQGVLYELPLRYKGVRHQEEKHRIAREAGGAWSEAYPAMEYRHGPISVAGPRTTVWTFGPEDAELLDDIRDTGAAVVEGRLDPMAELVLAQRVAVALAEARGLDSDRPRHLSRSVVLR